MLACLHFFMTLTGVWQGKRMSVRTHQAIFYTNSFLFTYYTIGFYLHTFKIFTDDKTTIDDVIDTMFTILSATNLLYNYIAIVFLRKEFRALVDNLMNFDKYGIPKNLRAYDERANVLTAFTFSYCFMAGAIIQMGAIFAYETCMEHSVRTNKDMTCGYGCKVHYPYKYQSGISQIVHVTVGVYSLSFLASSGGLFVCLFVSFVEYIIVRLDHLADMLLKVFDIEDYKDQKEALKLYVEYHILIMGLVEQTNSCLLILSTPALFIYSSIIGLSLFAILNGNIIKPSVNALGFIFTTFILSSYGQQLIMKSEAIGTAVYNSKWYHASPYLKKHAVFIITRSQKPFLMNVGFGFYFYLPLFTQIMRGAYTYMSLQINTD
uniref:Odorant receptor n=2 Tax=Holotrichia parallela TaxID=93412 RepID=A0A2P9JY52_HOLPA|nr:odorant receptor 12 [Holotrichia parallela]